jgi:hypothetical protein
MGWRRYRLLHHLLHQSRRQPRLAPASSTIAQPYQPGRRKAPDPTIYRQARSPHLRGDALLRQTLRAQQDDLGPLAVAHRCRWRTDAVGARTRRFNSAVSSGCNAIF